MKNLNMEIPDEIYDGAESVLEGFGFDLTAIVALFLSKVSKERALSFLFEKKEGFTQKSSMIEEEDNNTMQQYLPPFEKKHTTRDENRITKTMAIRLCARAGVAIVGDCTFATKNSTQYIYWANPETEVLVNDWYLILNDNINHRLYLFFVPKGSITLSQVLTRADRPNKIDMQILYNDPTFTDNRSDISFARFLIKEIDY